MSGGLDLGARQGGLEVLNGFVGLESLRCLFEANLGLHQERSELCGEGVGRVIAQDGAASRVGGIGVTGSDYRSRGSTHVAFSAPVRGDQADVVREGW